MQPTEVLSPTEGPLSAPLLDGSVNAVHSDAPAQREEQIRLAAFLLAKSRDFEPGHEAEDWLAAEQEVDGLLKAKGPLTAL